MREREVPKQVVEVGTSAKANADCVAPLLCFSGLRFVLRIKSIWLQKLLHQSNFMHKLISSWQCAKEASAKIAPIFKVAPRLW